MDVGAATQACGDEGGDSRASGPDAFVWPGAADGSRSAPRSGAPTPPPSGARTWFNSSEYIRAGGCAAALSDAGLSSMALLAKTSMLFLVLLSHVFNEQRAVREASSGNESSGKLEARFDSSEEVG